MDISQRSDEWFKQREGRFTASRISELLGERGFGLTGENYIFEKACEVVFGYDKENDFESFDMRRGTALEHLAFDMFKRKMEMDFIDVKKAEFFPYKEYGGASPDGLVGDYEALEIKCPRPSLFFKVLANGLKEVKKEYVDQMQMQMLCTKSIGCYFVNYIIYNGKEMGAAVYVYRDEKRIKFIKERLKQAYELREHYIKQILDNLEKNGL